MKIAFIGLGNMGGGMAANMVKAGHEVCDRVEDPTDRTLVFVKLTDEGLMALASYFRNLRSFAKWLVLDRP